MEMQRVWAMPSSETFSIQPIRQLVRHYLSTAKVSIDPFARNSNLTTFTNDLNPDTNAQHHLPALEFLELLVSQDVQADVLLFDPPYNVSQAKECYQSVGIDKLPEHNTSGWKLERNCIQQLIKPNGHVLSFGWNSQGIGLKRGFEIERILLVNHGREHYDTICTVERKLPNTQSSLF